VHLTKLAVHNFRAFVQAALELPADGVVFVAGPNNSGKSALLSALDIVAGVKPGERMNRINANGAMIQATFEMSESERLAILGTSPFAADWLNSPALSSVQYTFEQYMPQRAWISRIEAIDSLGHLQLLAESRRQDEGGSLVVEAAELASQVEQPVSPGFYARTHRASGSVPDHLPYGLADYKSFADSLTEWRSRFYHFEALRQGTTRDVASHGVLRLSPTGADLPQALLHLKSNDDPAWEEIVATMQAIVPDVGTLVTPVEVDRVQVAFRDPYLQARQNIKDLGTGVEQLLMTIYVGVRQPPGAVIVVEEPETNLHPGAQRALLRFVREWSRDKLFIFATHSTVFLDETIARVVLVERSHGVATAREASDDAQAVLVSLGVRLSDVLSAAAVVLVEGETDAEILRAWFPELTTAAGVAIAPMDGGDRAWSVDLVRNVLEAADKLGRRLSVIRDRNELRSESIRQLQETGLVHVLERRELENYLLDAAAIRTVLEQQRERPGADRQETMPTEALERVLRERADEVIESVVLKRVVGRMPNIRLIDRAEVARLIDEMPTLEALKAAVSSRLRPEEQLLKRLEDVWREEAEAIAESWEEHWHELAPGAELLDAVWAAHGGSFKKGRDGPLIAAAMKRPPEELRGVLERISADAERTDT
jgi:predicted ATPase